MINYFVEGSVLSVGLFIYLKVTKAPTLVGKYGMVSLVAILFILNALLMFGQPPSDSRISAALYLLLNISVILSAFWLDKKRN
jgi:hypothetical protein